MLKGTTKLRGSQDPRLPITEDILTGLISSCATVFQDPYDVILMQAVYSTMFHAFLRIGEAAIRSTKDIQKVIQLKDVSVPPSADSSPSMSIHIKHFKHNKSKDPFVIIIQSSPKFPCPVSLMKAFISLRGNNPGPLFAFRDGRPLNQSTFSTLFKRSLSSLGLDPILYLPHSFRIGACTHAASKGLPPAEIQYLGRWGSSAFMRYIRYSSLFSP